MCSVEMYPGDSCNQLQKIFENFHTLSLLETAPSWLLTEEIIFHKVKGLFGVRFEETLGIGNPIFIQREPFITNPWHRQVWWMIFFHPGTTGRRCWVLFHTLVTQDWQCIGEMQHYASALLTNTGNVWRRMILSSRSWATGVPNYSSLLSS